METAQQQAERFLRRERAFRLGSLVTEASHPKTHRLSQTLQEDVEAGIRLLLSVDWDIVDALERLFGQPGYERLVLTLIRTLTRGGRIFFTGCGATGRLAILLEAAWRAYWQDVTDRREAAQWEDRCVSVMAGGDYALIKSVEGFEDFPGFGRLQLREAGVQAGDAVVAITEGGETPFVIGTAWEGLEAGAEVFFVYNNPTELLSEQVARSRAVIEEPRIGKLDLCTGPMAITGSTRMQATTAELLVVGAALEQALGAVCSGSKEETPFATGDYQTHFRQLWEDLSRPEVVSALARATQFERARYQEGGLVTYWADWGLLDILTDTTERSPTFMVPAFRAADDFTSPASWAFVKHPGGDTKAAWQHLLGRAPRGLTWDASVYGELQAPAALRNSPPRLDNASIYRFRIGNEPDPYRCRGAHAAGVVVHCGAGLDAWIPQVLEQAQTMYTHTALLWIGGSAHYPAGITKNCICFPCRLPDSSLQLWRHLALKLVLNTLSTATMASLGRVLGNAMIWVSPSNKKLIDRGCRLIAQTTGCSYEHACVALHRHMLEIPKTKQHGLSSPVAAAIAHLKRVTDYRG